MPKILGKAILTVIKMCQICNCDVNLCKSLKGEFSAFVNYDLQLYPQYMANIGYSTMVHDYYIVML